MGAFAQPMGNLGLLWAGEVSKCVFPWQNVDPQIWTHRSAPMYFIMYFLMFLKSSTWGLSKGIMLAFLHRTAATLRQWKFCSTNGGATTDAGADAARALRHSSMLMKFTW